MFSNCKTAENPFRHTFIRRSARRTVLQFRILSGEQHGGGSKAEPDKSLLLAYPISG